MKITVLGSSGSVPTKDRNLPSIALTYEGEILLFDCGEGTQRQMLKYKLNIQKISKIFISHLHLDHYLGVYGILETIYLTNKDKKIKIYGPPGTKTHFGHYSSAEIYEISSKEKIIQENKYSISTFNLKHGDFVCLGYIFKEHDKIRFYEKKAKSAGIKGKLFTDIQKKKKLKINNKIIYLKDISYVETGKKISYISDTLPLKTTITNSKNSNLLIHDSTFSSELEEEAKQTFHSTTIQAAEIAKKAKVKKLLLFHISQRHKNSLELENQAKKVFKNSICAKDGLILEI